MAEHTPGPWTVEYDDDGVEIRAAGDLMGTIIHGGAMDANARLIASAPTLLRIVKTLLASWECDPDEDAQYEDLMDQAVGEAREAIAKVEGRE